MNSPIVFVTAPIPLGSGVNPLAEAAQIARKMQSSARRRATDKSVKVSPDIEKAAMLGVPAEPSNR